MFQYNITSEGKYEFTCHHGEAECNGNKVQACALHKLTMPDHEIDYIACLMTMVSGNGSVYPGNSVRNFCTFFKFWLVLFNLPKSV